MIFNISQLRDHIRCPQLAYNKHVLRRGMYETSDPLDLGTMFHKYMAERLAGRSMDIAAQALICPRPQVWDLWMKHKLWLPADAWSPPDDWEILTIEEPMHCALGQHTLQGTLDALIICDRWAWSAQWKTYADDLAGLVERVQIGWHESVGYPMLAEAWLDEHRPGTHHAGTILGAVQKLPGYRMVEDPITGKKSRRDVTDQERIDALSFHWISVKPELFELRRSDLWRYAEDMAVAHAPRRNPDACFNMFGGGRCQYWSSCYDSADLMSSPFVEIEDRYAIRTS